MHKIVIFENRRTFFGQVLFLEFSKILSAAQPRPRSCDPGQSAIFELYLENLFILIFFSPKIFQFEKSKIWKFFSKFFFLFFGQNADFWLIFDQK